MDKGTGEQGSGGYRRAQHRLHRDGYSGRCIFLAEVGQELHAKSYRPLPVKRCWIDKPGKLEKRTLGIPVIRDRVVQMAAQLVMEPIFETSFLPCSYCFRPERDAPRGAFDCRF